MLNVGTHSYGRRMLRLIDPDQTPPELAYPVPWSIVRTHAPRYRARNVGREVLERVTAADLATGELLTTGAARVPPGHAVDFRLKSPSTDAVILRWTRSTGAEYLFRITF